MINSRRKKIVRMTHYVENFSWRFLYKIKNALNSDFRIEMKKNRSLENIHKDSRCFIVANGPSIKKMNDLELLKNEFVFTVNQGYRSDLFDKIKPNYHVMVDPLFFSLDKNNKDENDSFQKMKTILTKKNIKFILPYTSKEYLINNNMYSENTFLIRSRYKMHENYSKKIMLHDDLPQIQNVVHAAIYSAIYMGFKEIYIIGCDMTNLLTNYVREDSENSIEEEHFYEYTAEEKNRMTSLRKSIDNETMLELHALIFNIFNNTRKYCERNEIKLYNAGISSALDNLPRITFNEIFKSKRN